jgi:hypothetical protein
MEKAEVLIRQLAPYLEIDRVIGSMPSLSNEKKDNEGESPTVNTADSQDGPGQLSRQASDRITYEDIDDSEGEDDEDAAYLEISTRRSDMKDLSPMLTNVKRKSDAPNLNAKLTTSSERAGPSGSTDNQNAAMDVPRQFLGKASEFHMLPLLEKLSLNIKSATPLKASDTSGVLAEMICVSPTGDGKDYSSYNFDWPDNDLRERLVDAYFARHNRDFPILNETVSRRMLSKATWEWKDGGSLLIALGILSVATRYVEDDRLHRPNGDLMGSHWHKMQKLLMQEELYQHGTAITYIQAILIFITCEFCVLSPLSLDSIGLILFFHLSPFLIYRRCGCSQVFPRSRLDLSQYSGTDVGGVRSSSTIYSREA